MLTRTIERGNQVREGNAGYGYENENENDGQANHMRQGRHASRPCAWSVDISPFRRDLQFQFAGGLTRRRPVRRIGALFCRLYCRAFVLVVALVLERGPSLRGRRID